MHFDLEEGVRSSGVGVILRWGRVCFDPQGGGLVADQECSF